MALWTQDDIDALKAAIITGVKRVRYRGPPEREVEYHSLKEMSDLLAVMTGSVNGGPRVTLAQVSKGYGAGYSDWYVK